MKPFISSNHHEVTEYGRLFYHLDSASRKDMRHFVDLEDEHPVCTCESYTYQTLACRHVKACLEYILVPFQLDEKDRDEAVEKMSLQMQIGFSFPESLVMVCRPLVEKFRQSKPSKPEPRKRIYNLRKTPHETHPAKRK